jgi:hypothetical protein
LLQAQFLETAEKEVQDTFCRGSWVPPALKLPKDLRYRGLIKTISEFSRSTIETGQKKYMSEATGN